MPWLPLRLTALTACFLLASCAASTPPVTAQPRPPPAEYAVRCPPPPPTPNDKADDVAAALMDMYALYGLCAGRLVDLLDWMDGGSQ